jgi:hypothetical protein
MGLYGLSCAIAAVPVTYETHRTDFSSFSINEFLIIVFSFVNKIGSTIAMLKSNGCSLAEKEQ